MANNLVDIQQEKIQALHEDIKLLSLALEKAILHYDKNVTDIRKRKNQFIDIAHAELDSRNNNLKSAEPR